MIEYSRRLSGLNGIFDEFHPRIIAKTFQALHSRNKVCKINIFCVNVSLEVHCCRNAHFSILAVLLNRSQIKGFEVALITKLLQVRIRRAMFHTWNKLIYSECGEINPLQLRFNFEVKSSDSTPNCD